jgi:two-component system C4-dicarboxylate transport response regulator DctD
MKPAVLVVDDEEQVRNSIVQWLELGGLTVESAANVHEALSAVRRNMPAVVLSDFKMPQKSGMDLLNEVHKIDPDVPVVLLTAHGDVQLAVAAMRAGAYDFLQKPYVPDHLTAVINRAVEQRKLKLELRELSDRVAARDGLETRLIGTSAAMIRLREMIAELAVHNRDVIVVGETGTGKEVVARALHDMGPRARAPFVAVNCAAVPLGAF